MWLVVKNIRTPQSQVSHVHYKNGNISEVVQDGFTTDHL